MASILINTYEAVISRTLMTPSAVDIERLDLPAPLHRLFQLLLGFVDVPFTRLQKPHQSAAEHSHYTVNDYRKADK